MSNSVHVYDTTLRDGAQQEGLNLSIADKMTIAGLLDELAVDFIEGGWPGAIPKDTEFFARANELELAHSTLAAFGSTRKPGVAVEDDEQVAALLAAGTPVVTLVAKSHVGHVERALRTTPSENLAMITDTIRYLSANGRRVFLDAEHFFDSFATSRTYALDVVAAADEAGAEVVALCDTNGGMLPSRVREAVDAVKLAVPGARLGMHAHNDTGCAVANSIAAVEAGATHVQGTINGYGERTGNADVLTVALNLDLKLGLGTLPEHSRAEASRIAHAISEHTNIPAGARQPYVGSSAFAHKAGLHASAIRVDPDLYQHIDPRAVGNDMRMLISDMAGRASIELKGKELGFDLAGDAELLGRVATRVKELESRGYTFDAADASFELLLREELGGRPHFFDVVNWRTIILAAETSVDGEVDTAEATVKVRIDGKKTIATCEGNGPVNALDKALRQVLEGAYPQLAAVNLVDYKVRILDSASGTDAVTRVLIESTDGAASWTTVGVAANVVEASWVALLDSLVYYLAARSDAVPAPVPVGAHA
ncbi:citramalate synthase [Spelaeicoccus albus]|uniref:Citramalate synthase n=1 Tax=Spelaeicoccus albus TaxID=1280376 RepID=A0A7Z0IHN8_9MICO|nr:citramalate synthase [Spelaeicoccus albus]NYI67702.1 2-isopropylmalate synthase [Spelaeicoccus albus]